MSPDPALPAFPRVLEKRYRPVGLIGTGGMGAVVRADDLELGRPVAIKVLRLGRDPELEARFELEARSLARLEHPSVVRVYDAGWSDEGPWMVMELLEGSPLSEIPGLPDPLGRMMEAARGLSAMHGLGLVHRDVKPSNLVRVADGSRVVLLDFGIVKDLAAPRRTRTGVVLGTLAYAAPEVLAGGDPTPRSDWYSWGASLFHLCEGRIPWEVAEVMRRRHGRDPGPPGFAALGPEYLERRVIEACLATDPSARPGDLRDLEALIERGGRQGAAVGATMQRTLPAVPAPGPAVAAGPTTRLDPVDRGPAARWRSVAGGVGLLAVGGLVGAYLATGSATPEIGMPTPVPVGEVAAPSILARVWPGPGLAPVRVPVTVIGVLDHLEAASRERARLEAGLREGVGATLPGAPVELVAELEERLSGLPQDRDGGRLLALVRHLVARAEGPRLLRPLLADGAGRLADAFREAARAAPGRPEREWLAMVMARLGHEVSPFCYADPFRVDRDVLFPPGEPDPPGALIEAEWWRLVRVVARRRGLDPDPGGELRERALLERASLAPAAGDGPGGAFASQRADLALVEWVNRLADPVDARGLAAAWARDRERILGLPERHLPWVLLGLARALAIPDGPARFEADDAGRIRAALRGFVARLPSPYAQEAELLSRE